MSSVVHLPCSGPSVGVLVGSCEGIFSYSLRVMLRETLRDDIRVTLQGETVCN